MINLHPTALGASSSYAVATKGTQQVGYINTDRSPYTRAVVWSGSADSAVDLQSLLPAGLYDSSALSIEAAENIFGVALSNNGADLARDRVVADARTGIARVCRDRPCHRPASRETDSRQAREYHNIAMTFVAQNGTGCAKDCVDVSIVFTVAYILHSLSRWHNPPKVRHFVPFCAAPAGSCGSGETYERARRRRIYRARATRLGDGKLP